MKKLFVIFSSQNGDEEEGEFKKIGGRAQSKLGKDAQKWDFKLQDTFMGVIVGRHEFPNPNYVGQMSQVYECIHLPTKKEYFFFGATALNERMLATDAKGEYVIPDYSKIRVKCLGKPKGKTYYVFEVEMSSTFVWNPDDFPNYVEKNIEYEKVAFPAKETKQAVEKPAVTGTAQGTTGASTRPAPVRQAPVKEEFDEPPF